MRRHPSIQLANSIWFLVLLRRMAVPLSGRHKSLRRSREVHNWLHLPLSTPSMGMQILVCIKLHWSGQIMTPLIATSLLRYDPPEVLHCEDNWGWGSSNDLGSGQGTLPLCWCLVLSVFRQKLLLPDDANFANWLAWLFCALGICRKFIFSKWSANWWINRK